MNKEEFIKRYDKECEDYTCFLCNSEPDEEHADDCAYIKFREASESSNEKPGRTTKTRRQRVLSIGSAAGKDALVRKTVRSVVKIAQQGGLSLLKNSSVGDPALKKKIAAVLKSDLGAAAMAVLSLLLVYKLPILKQETKDALIQELLTQAFDNATAPLDQAASLILPKLTEAVAPLAALEERNA